MDRIEVKVLLVEDNPADVLFLREALAQAASAVFELTVVESLAQALTSVAQQTFAAALLDLGLPDSLGVSTFQRFHQAAPDLPVVVLSALNDEAVAMQAMQAGAQDYLVKHPQEFSAAGRALRYAIERHKNQAALRESEQSYTALFQKSGIPVVLLKLPEVVMVDVNEAAEKLTGYQRAELIGKNSVELGIINPQQRSNSMAQFEQAGLLQANEMRIVTKTGEERIITVDTHPIEINGQPFAFTAFQDITERKQAEAKLRESEGRAHAMLDAIPDMMFRLDRNGTFLDYKADVHDLYEQSQSLIGRRNREVAPPEFADLIERQIEATLNAGQIRTFEYQLPVPAGGVQDFEARMAPSGPDEVIAIVRNITARKLAEEKLQTLTNLLSDGQRIAHLGSFEYDAATQRTVWSEEECRIYGYDPAQPSPDYETMLAHSIHPADADLLNRTFQAAMQHGTVYELEHRIVQPAGGVRWVYDRAQPYFDERGQLLRYVGVTQDITERKQAEKLVRQWADAFENCAHGIAIGLPATNQIMTCNPAFARLQGRTIEEISAMPILSMYAPEDHAHVIKNIMEADLQGSIRYEAHMVRKDGTRYPVQMDVVSVRDEAGNILYRVATQQDITERKQAEEKLRESETLLRQVLESTQDAIFAIDREYRLLVNNDAHQQVLVATGGHPLQAGENVLPPDYPPPMLEDWRAMYDRAFGGESTHLELEWTDIYGKPRAYENNILPLRDAAGTIVGVLATAHDITERKQTEEKLRASEQFLKESQRIANMGSWQFDPATLKLNWSENCYRLFGFEPGEVEPTLELFKQAVHPADRQLVEEASNSLLQHPRPFEYEYRIVDKHGRTKWLYNSIKPTLEGHQVVQFTGIHIDITERQQATNLLQQQTEKLRILYAASRQLSSTLDLKVIYETVSDLMGEVAPNDGLMISHFDPHRRLITCQAYKLDRQWQNVAEFPPIPLEDEGRGTQSRVILTGQPLLLNDYRAYGQTARTRYIFDSETGTLSDITADTSEADLQDLPGSALLVPLKSGGAVTGVLQLFCNRRAAYTDDHLQLLEALAVHISAAEQNARLYAQTQAELGERTAAEEKLSASEQQLQALVTSLDDIVFEVDERGIYRNIWTANDAMLFLPREQIIGRRFDEVFGAEASRPFFDYLERCLQSGQPQNLEYPMELPGRVRWFNARYNLIRSGTAKPKTASIMVRDITRRKQAEAALAESENRFRALIEHSSDGIVVLSAEGQVVYESPTASRLIGFTPEERQSRSGFENIHPADLPLARAKFAQLASQPGSVIQVEYRALRKDGSLWWAEVVATNLLNEPGVQGIVVNFRDSTERKQAEEQLRASEERYRQAIIAAGAIPYALDYATNQYTFIGEGLEKLTGYAAHELDLNEFSAWLIESVMQGELKGLELLRASQLVRAGQAGGIWKCQHHLRTRDGRELWLADAAVQVLNDAGLPVGSIGILQDITEHKETEKVLAERIQQATAEIQDLYDNAPAGYHSLDDTGCFVQINQTELDWLGYTRAEVIGRPFTDFATERGLATFTQNYPGFKQRGWLRDLEIEFLRKDGTTFQALVNATAIWDKDGRYVMSRSTVLDISERKQAEQELRDSRDRLDLANRELERASRAKDEFLANMSHELRTPLNAVLGMAQSLGEQYIGPLNPRQLEAAAVIETSGRHLLELINDILDLSKIESGNVTLDLTAVDVPTICRASLLFIKQVAHRKNIQVSSRFDAAVTGLSADERRLKQMLVNLLNNAVKFTPEGGQVELTVKGDRAAQTVQFTIRDTGIGIAPADLPRLFKPFVQLDSGLTRQYEGTGLGLSIVLRLAQLHGGSVTAASEPGQGSVFTITLPWTEPAPTPAGEPAPLAALGPTLGADQPAPLILIAEDNEANILTLRANLEPQGYRLVIARHGGEVLEKVQIARPALILLDLQMPVMDGLETLRRLRSNPDPGLASLPVIALTALAMPADRDRALAAGANAFLPKPINVRQLMDLIQHLLQEH